MNSRSLFFPAIAILLLLFHGPETASAEARQRMKVGLTLSGGGAKGLAHIGVLKVLEEEGIKIDFISGTSMGSIVGGLYAVGYDAKALEKLALEMDWADLLNDTLARNYVTIDDKNDHEKYLASFPLKRWSIELPKGLIKGQKLSSTLSRLTLHAQHIRDFRQLPIPFVCIGTDIENGDAYVLDHGSLADAMRASMAIPSVFTPIEIDKRLLVDGGVKRNLPVSDVKKLGATVVIAVDVGAPLYKKEEIGSLAEIMDQSISFFGAGSTKEERTKANVLITPDIKGYGASSFEAAKALIANGEAAARKELPKLREIARLQKSQMRDREEPAPIYPLKRLKIVGIKIDGLDHVSENLVRGRLLLGLPSVLTPEDIEDAISRVYASQFFERVSYEVVPVLEGYILSIKVVETTATFLKLGFSYDSDLKAGVLINTTFRNMLGEGSKLSLDARLSENPGAKVEYLIFSGIRKPGVGLGIAFDYNRLNTYTYNYSYFYDRIYQIKSPVNFSNFTGTATIQATFFNFLSGGFGVQKEYFDVKSLFQTTQQTDTINLGKDSSLNDYDALNYFVFLNLDTLDSTYYPHKGVKLYAEVKYLKHQLMFSHSKDFSDFYKYTAKLMAAIPLHRKFTFSMNLACGSVVGTEPYHFVTKLQSGQIIISPEKKNLPEVYLNYLGGLYTYRQDYFPFTGLDFMQLSGKAAIAGRFALQFEPWRDKFMLLRFDMGKVGDNLGQILHHYRFIMGYGVTLGANTIIGPIEMTLMRSSLDKQVSLSVNIGYRLI